MAIETLRAEDFLPHVGQRFPLATAGPQALELLSVTPAQGAAAGHRPGFALLFRSAGPAVAVQTVLDILHPTRGAVAVFVVPVGQDSDGVRYEAIFN